ncbi:AzlD domain-containing protein [Natroniella sulfidigena]|uniref:AzlD domain-containing protein n=1 Tax=Natroniella sulfidigena TaxID=723921 RepID=UPI00200B8A83|nr:AzlD domain-containing protein [Natroniella sulfidigena]MCK8818020.1 AzlD domain-containing protein [Natroniella sulfidigena]
MNLFYLILGMTAVTYIPRALPMVLLKELNLPPFLNRFLEFIPYAALGALIFPGILSSTGSLLSAILGGIIAIIIALIAPNLLLIVIGGIVGAFIGELLI